MALLRRLLNYLLMILRIRRSEEEPRGWDPSLVVFHLPSPTGGPVEGAYATYGKIGDRIFTSIYYYIQGPWEVGKLPKRIQKRLVRQLQERYNIFHPPEPKLPEYDEYDQSDEEPRDSWGERMSSEVPPPDPRRQKLPSQADSGPNAAPQTVCGNSLWWWLGTLCEAFGRDIGIRK